MRSVTYSMGVSLDGYIVGPDGDITAPPPDEEVWRFVTDEIREVGVHLMGGPTSYVIDVPLPAKSPTKSPECPREESNLRTRFRKPLLYPLSYEGRGQETWKKTFLTSSIQHPSPVRATIRRPREE